MKNAFFHTLSFERLFLCHTLKFLEITKGRFCCHNSRFNSYAHNITQDLFIFVQIRHKIQELKWALFITQLSHESYLTLVDIIMTSGGWCFCKPFLESQSSDMAATATCLNFQPKLLITWKEICTNPMVHQKHTV